MHHGKVHLHLQAETTTIREWLSNNNIALLILPMILLLSIGGALALINKDTRLGFSLLIAASLLLSATSPRLPSTVFTSSYQSGSTAGVRRIAGIACLLGSIVFAVQAAVIFAGFKAEEIPGALPWDSFVTGVVLWVLGGLFFVAGQL